MLIRTAPAHRDRSRSPTPSPKLRKAREGDESHRRSRSLSMSPERKVLLRREKVRVNTVKRASMAVAMVDPLEKVAGVLSFDSLT